MKKYIFLPVISLLTVFSVCYASIFPPNCVCEITAKVISVEEREIGEDGHQGEVFTTLSMEIEIIDVGPMIKSGVSPELTCNQYKIGERLAVYPVKERDFIDKDVKVEPGVIIKGDVEYTGDENGTGHYFEKISVVNER